METPDIRQYHYRPFWDDSYRTLTYQREDFGDRESVERWLSMGFANKFVGDMCDMRRPQPGWNHKIVELYELCGWRDIGTSYYRMRPGTILPRHQDQYLKYIQLYDLKGREHTIWRAIIFLEDWASGHYLEVGDRAITKWKAGDVVEWRYDVPHLAANMGTTDRYTLQITGHKNDSKPR